MSEELKACPFCEGRAVQHDGRTFCDACGIGYEGEYAVGRLRWNTRPSVSEEKVEEMAREIEDDANGHVACNWRDYEDGTENREELRSSIAAILRKHLIGEVK